MDIFVAYPVKRNLQINIILRLEVIEMDKYEVIIPEKIYIVNGLEGVKETIERYKLKGVCVRLIK